MKNAISFTLILALGLTTEVANADFTFGTPTNLGSVVNSSALDWRPSISNDNLSLYFNSTREGGYGNDDIWVAVRETTENEWGEPVNLGSPVNSPSLDGGPCISADGLELFFLSNRPGGYGDWDIWVTSRVTKDDPWSVPVNLGPRINSAAREGGPSISTDGLSLYFASGRPGSYGINDIWVTTKVTKDAPWGEPMNLGPNINTSSLESYSCISSDDLALFFQGGSNFFELWMAKRKTKDEPWGLSVPLPSLINTSRAGSPCLSPDGLILYFGSDGSGGIGSFDLWQASIIPIVDLNGDGIVDSVDMCIMVGYWGTDNPLCDIGPMPWGDGIVDVEDLIVLAEHLFEEFPQVN